MILFRHGPQDRPFFWETADQPPARWHDRDEGPVQYFADTPDAAWAEFLRHEGISDPLDLPGVSRAIWAVDIPNVPSASAELDYGTLTGDGTSYDDCRTEARRLRRAGEQGFEVPTAALKSSESVPWKVHGGLKRSTPRRANTIVLFGVPLDCDGWLVATQARPDPDLLPFVNHF